MLPKPSALVPVALLGILGAACAAPSEEPDDEGTTESRSFAATKRTSKEGTSTASSSDLAISGKVSSSCIDASSASVRVAVELTSGSSDTVVVSMEGAFSDSLTIGSNAWSKQKGGSNWAFVASTQTLANGDYTISVCATQSSVSKQACASYAFVVACD